MNDEDIEGLAADIVIALIGRAGIPESEVPDSDEIEGAVADLHVEPLSDPLKISHFYWELVAALKKGRPPEPRGEPHHSRRGRATRP